MPSSPEIRPELLPDDRVALNFKEDGEATPAGRLEVGFRWEDRNGQRVPTAVTEIRLSMRDGLTATDLTRLPWGTYLRMAESFARYPGAFALGMLIKDLIGQWREHRKGDRPGRKGHPDEHYEQVAEAYRVVSASGERAPVQRLADELGYPRNTVAGWVREARERGLLSPARPGKAG